MHTVDELCLIGKRRNTCTRLHANTHKHNAINTIYTCNKKKKKKKNLFRASPEGISLHQESEPWTRCWNYSQHLKWNALKCILNNNYKRALGQTHYWCWPKWVYQRLSLGRWPNSHTLTEQCCLRYTTHTLCKVFSGSTECERGHCAPLRPLWDGWCCPVSPRPRQILSVRLRALWHFLPGSQHWLTSS